MLGRGSVGVGSSSRGGFRGSSSKGGFRGSFRGSGSGVIVVVFTLLCSRIVSTYDDIISCYMLCGTGCSTSYYFWSFVVTFRSHRVPHYPGAIPPGGSHGRSSG